MKHVSPEEEKRKTPVTRRRLVGIGVAACAALALLPMPIVRTAAVSILDPVQTSVRSRTPSAKVAPQGKRSRFVRVNLAPLPPPGGRARAFEEDVELALFPGVTLKAVFDRFETIAGSGTWVGHVEGIPMSSVTLAYRDGLLSANISTTAAAFQIQPAPGFEATDHDLRPLHVVSEIDLTTLPEGPDVLEPPAIQGSVAFPRAAADGAETIDLMVVYTPAAMARAGGATAVVNAIAGQVAETNAAYVNSDINLRINLVHTALVPFTESSSGQADLTALRAGSSGLEGVAALRNAHGADLVQMMVGPQSYNVCGVGYLSAYPGQGESLGYSVIADGCRSVFVMAHELGHNLGAHHDWYVEGNSGPYGGFNHGHVDPSARWRTVMAYDDLCRAQGFSCGRVNYFSTPDKEYIRFCSGTAFNCDLLRAWFYPSSSLGVREQRTDCQVGTVSASPCAADNRRVINETASTVANYRQSR